MLNREIAKGKIEKMKTFRTAIRSGLLAAVACASIGAAFGDQHGFDGGGFGNSGGTTASTATTVTSVSGTLTQFNYDESGAAPESMLIGTSVILTFPGTVCGGLGTLGAAGNGVTYSGTAVTFSNGFQAVSVSSFTNTTTKVTWTPPTVPKPTAYAATAGTIKSLNYGPHGDINGFVFTPTTGTAVFVDLGGAPNSTLAPLLKVSAAVTVTGTLEAAPLCSAAGTIQEVDATTLLFGTTTITLKGNR